YRELLFGGIDPSCGDDVARGVDRNGPCEVSVRPGTRAPDIGPVRAGELQDDEPTARVEASGRQDVVHPVGPDLLHVADGRRFAVCPDLVAVAAVELHDREVE